MNLRIILFRGQGLWGDDFIARLESDGVEPSYGAGGRTEEEAISRLLEMFDGTPSDLPVIVDYEPPGRVYRLGHATYEGGI